MRAKACLSRVLMLCLVFVALGCPPRVPVLRLIFNQGTFGDTAYLSESEHSVFFDTENQMGDDFRLTGRTSAVTHVTWWGAYANNTPVEDNFLLTVYRDNGAGMPESGGYWEQGAGDQVNRTATSGVVEPGVLDLTIYEYSCNVEDWDFETDTIYYLSIVNDTASGTWMWCANGSSSQGNDFGVHRVTWGEDWTANTVDMAFVLRSNR